MTRSSFFIDGFNLYHSLIDKFTPLPTKYKWLNLKKLASCFINKNEEITKIYYFSALAEWDTSKVIRHQKYIKALQYFEITPVMGKFKKRSVTCKVCKKIFSKHDEKQTDVNIAIQLIKSAYLDEYDVAYVLSGDSDLIPSIKAIKSLFPQKKIRVIIPFGRSANELSNECEKSMKIKRHHLDQSLFSDNILDNEGNIIVSRPTEWV
ncbi:MAG TPA: NYN domain-containing protein [Spirochaetota bacterium]|nr:NYN domain-containing protein [Spirochaetota bacterium]